MHNVQNLLNIDSTSYNLLQRQVNGKQYIEKLRFGNGFNFRARNGNVFKLQN